MDAARAPGGPVVVGANWYGFRPGEHIRHERVMSACVLWVQGGSGTVASGGVAHPLAQGSVLALPWGHDVEYRPDDRTPFRLGTVHVVPWHDAGVPVVPRVAHQPDDPLLDAPARRGGDPTSALLLPGGSDAARRTATLGAYVVERFAEGGYDERVFRALGVLLVAERASWSRSRVDGVVPGSVVAAVDDEHVRVPPALERMTAHIAANLDRALDVAEVAAIGGCSTATAERVFTRYTGSSVGAWIRATRMREAATLLRTSGLRVSEVARAVGIADPLYFSRVFRRTFGVAPSRYARDQLRP
jgi:AraC-like DNA-binding protein